MSQSDSDDRPLTQACSDDDERNGDGEFEEDNANISVENVGDSEGDVKLFGLPCDGAAPAGVGCLTSTSSWRDPGRCSNVTVASSVATETLEQRERLHDAERQVNEHGARDVLEGLSRAITPAPESMHAYLARAAVEALEHPLSVVSPCVSFARASPAAMTDVGDLTMLSGLLSPLIQPLSTGCQSIDSLLGGGIPLDTHGLFEVSGAAGAGKTQLVAQLCLMCGAPHSTGGQSSMSIYASTEGRPATKRLKMLSTALSKRLASQHERLREREQIDLAGRVVVEHVRTSEHLLEWARFRLPYLLRETAARLVVVDSVAAVFRVELPDPVERAQVLVRLARALRNAVTAHNAACVCVNQVSQAIDPRTGSLDMTVPALGNAWAQLVDTRLFIRRIAMSRNVRVAHVVHSSYLPSSGGVDGGFNFMGMGGGTGLMTGGSVRFKITGEGVEDDD